MYILLFMYATILCICLLYLYFVSEMIKQNCSTINGVWIFLNPQFSYNKIHRQLLPQSRHRSLPAAVPTMHYNDVITSTMAFQITGSSIIYSTVCSGADQRKHQSSASLAFVWGIHRWPVNSPHKGPVTQKCFHLMGLPPTTWDDMTWKLFPRDWPFVQGIHRSRWIPLTKGQSHRALVFSF